MVPMALQLVNSTKSDGFTPLQVAALNGYVATATVLIEVVSYYCNLKRWWRHDLQLKFHDIHSIRTHELTREGGPIEM